MANKRALLCLAAVFLVPGLCAAQVPVMPATDQPALLESPDPQLARNKKLVYDYFREVLEAGHTDLVEKYIAADFVQHDPNMTGGRDRFAAFVKARRPVPQPFQPTLRVPLVTIVAERDLVVMVFLKSGPVREHPGQEYTSTSAEIYRIANDQIAEHWSTTVRE
jgi:predicted SnoaL-like aldol condensation-catalyzing enzyme